MSGHTSDQISRVLLLAPVIFVCHFLEEAPTFVEWFNSHVSRYVPGLLTAVVLYIPYYLWLFVKALKSERVNVSVLVGSSVLASIPMLIHGYLIVFRGDRLF